MNPQHIIQGAPEAFAKAANKFIKERDISLALDQVSCCGGKLAAVIEEVPRAANASGSLIEVVAKSTADPNKLIAGLRAANPLWRVEAVFAVESESKGKAATLVIASLRQP
jgi:hypothetical protein